MRLNTTVYFCRKVPGAYNSQTGDYAPGIISEMKTYADVTDVSTESLTLIYGKLKQGAKVIRLLRPYTEPFDSIRIENTVYRVDFQRQNKTFIVSEVQ